jgi:hypothetical protein
MGPRIRVGAFVTLSLLGAAAALPATAATPAPPLALTGEALNGTITDLVENCATGSLSFDVSGSASGPYAGTFTAHVEVSSTSTASPPFSVQYDLGAGIVVEYNAAVRSTTTISETFEIRSADGEVLVSGSKTQVNPGAFYCAQNAHVAVGGFDFGTPSATFAQLQTAPDGLAYSASIPTTDGVYTDAGTSTLAAVDIVAPSDIAVVIDNEFHETFTSTSLTPPVPAQSPVPAAKDDCEDGGWKDFARTDGSPFKNQGDCIQFVNTGK